jgi:hypothetical protein
MRGEAMPMIDLTYVQGSLDGQALGQLTDKLVALHVWTLIHEIPEGNWAGGSKIIYYRQVKVLVADDAE